MSEKLKQVLGNIVPDKTIVLKLFMLENVA